MNDHFKEIHLLLEEQQYDQAAKKLEELPVQKLTGEEQSAAGALFAMLPQEILDSSVDLCYNLTILNIQAGDMEAAKKWNGHLTSMRDTIKGTAQGRQLLENRIFCAALCSPLIPGSNLLLNLAVLANEFGDVKFPTSKVSVTGKFPSVLRGAKDLSGLAKHYRATVSIVKPLLGAFLEDNGAGVCEAAIAELLYEKNDLSGASLQAAAALAAENPEVAFAALAILARIGAVDTTSKQPAEILSHLGDLLEKKSAHWLIPNYKAFRARFHMLRGDVDEVRRWVDSCELNELNGCILRDSYELITKAKAYIALGEYMSAATLLESLTLSMQKEQRILDTVECLVNGAIVCELLGNGELALQKLEQALLLAQEYGYIRVFADHGKLLFHLIVRYIKEAQAHEELSDKYIKKITEAAKVYSTLYPALYQARNGGGDGNAEESEELTQSELHVLQLLDEGKSNKDIADKLHISNSTVKKHIAHIFTKLKAANRVEAIKNARGLGILA